MHHFKVKLSQAAFFQFRFRFIVVLLDILMRVRQFKYFSFYHVRLMYNESPCYVTDRDTIRD